ncbi:MAG TPA: YdeI/OmpD-associated family protein [Candidatus Nanoarchaeia archaeon]|nr:YdeI/OmpD-associated family protein [Candidatus Nanoarchaeia archaeon]
MRKQFKVKLGGAGKYGEVAVAQVPFDVKELWGKARIPVKGTINGFSFRTTVMRMDGRYCFCVNATMRKGANVDVGDTVHIALEPDTAPRVIEIPAELKKSLGAKLTGKLESMAYTHQKEFVNWYTEAKKDETRERRVEKMKEMLGSGKTIS